MKNIGKISATSAILCLLFFSSFGFAWAQTNTDYTVLAPLPGITTANCGGDTPTGELGCTTNLQTYLPGAFNLVIGLCAVLAFLVLTYGGVLYMTSDAITGKSQGKTYIENALWGLGLAIASWVILYTINPAILHFNLQLAQPNTNPQSAIDLAAITAASQTTPGLTAAGSDLLSGASLTSDNTNRGFLAAQNIVVNNPPCTTSKTTNCTDVNNLTPTMISSLGSLESNTCSNSSDPSCSLSQCTATGSIRCAVTITGGDETSLHNPGTAHGNGTTVDLAPTGALNGYLASQNTIASNPVNGTKVIINGMTFTYETNGANAANTGAHWHVTQP
jgi:hypothetical protein